MQAAAVLLAEVEAVMLAEALGAAEPEQAAGVVGGRALDMATVRETLGQQGGGQPGAGDLLPGVGARQVGEAAGEVHEAVEVHGVAVPPGLVGGNGEGGEVVAVLLQAGQDAGAAGGSHRGGVEQGKVSEGPVDGADGGLEDGPEVLPVQVGGTGRGRAGGVPGVELLAPGCRVAVVAGEGVA